MNQLSVISLQILCANFILSLLMQKPISRMVRRTFGSRFTDLDHRLLAQLIFKISRWLKADDQLSTEKVERKILNDPWQGRLISPWSTIFWISSSKIRWLRIWIRLFLVIGTKEILIRSPDPPYRQSWFYYCARNSPWGLLVINRQFHRFGRRAHQKCRVFHY